MTRETGYRRDDVLQYAKQWAMAETPDIWILNIMGETVRILHPNVFMPEAK